MNSLALALVLGASPTPTPTVQYIRTVAPYVRSTEAVRLGGIIDTVAKGFALDPVLLAAVVRQESNFKSGIKACWFKKPKSGPTVTCDYGLAQVNQVWIEKWNLDPDKLANDDTYNLRVAARIFKNIKNAYGDTEPTFWYTRYHSKTPSKRREYDAHLEVFLALR